MSADRCRVFLEREDRPPPSYYQENSLNQLPLKKQAFQTPAAEEWIKAPEFVPRSKLEETFNPPCDVIGASSTQDNSHQSIPFAPFCADYTTHFPPGTFPPSFPMFPSNNAAGLPPNMIPDGYSANITHINPGVGPPIPAIVLRKKRRKRNRQTNSLAMNSSESPSSSQARTTATPDQKVLTEEEEDNFRADRFIGGSCPDLSEEQLEMWDNFLYDTAVSSNKENTPQDIMKTSAYEIVPRCLLDIAEQHMDGISNPELRKLDREINGNSMTASMVMQRLQNHNEYFDAAGSTEKSLAAELGELTFRPEFKYGYPQINSENVQLATVHHGTVHSKIVPRSKLRKHSLDSEEEDCFEGMNITINAFDPCEELSLTDTEAASPSRFEQIQQALRRGTELRPPDRVCCSIQ